MGYIEWRVFALIIYNLRGQSQKIESTDGDRGRIAMVHQTHHGKNPKGAVAAEIIINYLITE